MIKNFPRQKSGFLLFLEHADDILTSDLYPHWALCLELSSTITFHGWLQLKDQRPHSHNSIPNSSILIKQHTHVQHTHTHTHTHTNIQTSPLSCTVL